MNGQPALESIPHAHVERRLGVQGGRPVIRGTRVLVSTLVTTLVTTYRAGASIEDLLTDFSNFQPAQVHDALSAPPRGRAGARRGR